MSEHYLFSQKNFLKYTSFIILNALLLVAGNLSQVNANNIDENTNIISIGAKSNVAKISFEEQAAIIKQLLKQNKFQKVEQILNHAIKEQTRSRGGFLYAGSVLSSLFDKTDLSLLEPLNNWIEEYPESSLAYTVRGYFYYDYAWSIRGHRYIRKTAPEKVEEYSRLLALCANDIKQALDKNPENPLALLYVLRIGRNTNMSREVFEYYFSEANSIIPNFIRVYQEKMLYLDPNWHGSETELLNFVRITVANAPRETAMPLLLPQTHENITKKNNRKDYYNQPRIWNEIKQSYLKLIEDFPESGMYPLWFAEMAEDAGKEIIAQRYYALALEREPQNTLIQKKVAKFQQKARGN